MEEITCNAWLDGCFDEDDNLVGYQLRLKLGELEVTRSIALNPGSEAMGKTPFIAELIAHITKELGYNDKDYHNPTFEDMRQREIIMRTLLDTLAAVVKMDREEGVLS